MNIVVDIDGTLLYTEQQPSGYYKILEFNKKLIDKLNFLYDNNNRIIVYTAQHWDLFEHTQEQIKGIGLNVI